MGEIDTMPSNDWPYAYCNFCMQLAPIRAKGIEDRLCMSCGAVVTVTGNAVVYLSVKEAQLRKLAHIDEKTK